MICIFQCSISLSLELSGIKDIKGVKLNCQDLGAPVQNFIPKRFSSKRRKAVSLTSSKKSHPPGQNPEKHSATMCQCMQKITAMPFDRALLKSHSSKVSIYIHVYVYIYIYRAVYVCLCYPSKIGHSSLFNASCILGSCGSSPKVKITSVLDSNLTGTQVTGCPL